MESCLLLFVVVVVTVYEQAQDWHFFFFVCGGAGRGCQFRQHLDISGTKRSII